MTPFFRTLVSVAALALATGASAQARDDALLAATTAEQAAAVKTLEKLVNIETGTGNAEGLSALAQHLELELKGLGATVTRHKAEGAAVGDNLVGRLQGKGGKKLLLMAHMDTVYVKGTLAKAPFRLEIDKADEEFEAFLFEMLAESSVTVPEIGTLRALAQVDQSILTEPSTVAVAEKEATRQVVVRAMQAPRSSLGRTAVSASNRSASRVMGRA